jgi:hypothetical protein
MDTSEVKNSNLTGRRNNLKETTTCDVKFRYHG